MTPELRKDERNEELTEDHDGEQPDVLRAAGSDAEHEQRIDPDDRRDVAERDGEVLEKVEHPPQLLPVAEPGKLGRILISRFWRRDHGFATHRAPPPCLTATAGGMRPEVSISDYGVRKR